VFAQISSFFVEKHCQLAVKSWLIKFIAERVPEMALQIGMINVTRCSNLIVMLLTWLSALRAIPRAKISYTNRQSIAEQSAKRVSKSLYYFSLSRTDCSTSNH
jgi:hypothetical protein